MTMNEQDIQQLSIYTQSLFIFAVRHENSSDDNLQGNTFRTLPEIKYWLETKGWIVYIWPEFYKDGFCFNWQVFAWDKSDKDGMYINGGYSTGAYGDNGEYKTSIEAERYGVIRALELYCLATITDKALNKKLGFEENTSLLDVYSKINMGVPCYTVDTEWYNYKRKTAKEYIDYIKQRIIEVYDLQNG